MTVEQFEHVLESKPLKFTGWSTVLLMIIGNLARLIPHMNLNINDIFLLISTIAGTAYLVFKSIIAFYTVKEKIYENRQRRLKRRREEILDKKDE